MTAIRLLMLTVCGRNEILTLPWEHVDLDNAEIRIVDGKIGSRTVHLSPSAVEVLKALPRKPGNRWVITGAKPGTHMTDIDGARQSVRARAGLHDVPSTTSVIPSPLGRSLSARACRFSAACWVTDGRRPPRDTCTSHATRSGNPPSESPSASPLIFCRRSRLCGMKSRQAQYPRSSRAWDLELRPPFALRMPHSLIEHRCRARSATYCRRQCHAANAASDR